MASRIEMANAANVFRLQKLGGRFASPVLVAARRTLAGQGNANDAQLIRFNLGIAKSGATQAKNALRAANAATSTVIQIGQSVEMIQRGGTAASIGVLNLIKV